MPLMNLWLSVPPKVLVTSMASLIIDRIRCFGHRTQFVAGHQQDAALNRVDVFFIAVEQGADDLHVFRAVAVRAEKQGVEQIGVCTFEVEIGRAHV